MTALLPVLYLASQSPRRRQLLDQIGVRHELLLPLAGEDAEALEATRHGESPRRYVERVTRAKWAAACARHKACDLPPGCILCADTTVALGDLILGKPEDSADAARILQLLSGQTHRVLTAVMVGRSDGLDAPKAAALAVSVSRVRWAQVSQADIDAYVASGEPMGKAGAYAIQSRAAMWIERIQGSYSGIMGLPLFETSRLLRQTGWTL
ncbi:MAG: nucleoside triphosphate pyrophosphatase [Leptothrix ochracea]|uniref:Maf family protein n=1 Tax=Leptothrix ochracea TaxID=735331 RepID=UPI0034E28D10